ncbi:unnamed protein product [Calypogeia fissa]
MLTPKASMLPPAKCKAKRAWLSTQGRTLKTELGELSKGDGVGINTEQIERDHKLDTIQQELGKLTSQVHRSLQSVCHHNTMKGHDGKQKEPLLSGSCASESGTSDDSASDSDDDEDNLGVHLREALNDMQSGVNNPEAEKQEGAELQDEDEMKALYNTKG